MIGALREATAATQVGDAQQVAATCYTPLERDLLDELVATKDDAKSRPQFLINACPVLKTHGTSTIAKKRKCP